jgi:hypothetical protein
MMQQQQDKQHGAAQGGGVKSLLRVLRRLASRDHRDVHARYLLGHMEVRTIARQSDFSAEGALEFWLMSNLQPSTAQPITLCFKSFFACCMLTATFVIADHPVTFWAATHTASHIVQGSLLQHNLCCSWLLFCCCRSWYCNCCCHSGCTSAGPSPVGSCSLMMCRWQCRTYSA